MPIASRRSLCGATALVGALTLAAGAADAQARAFTFDIPAESLSKALRDYGRMTHQQLVFSEALTSGKTAPAVAGSLGAAEALDRILAGSGLAAERTPDGAWIIQRGGQAAGPQDPGATAIAELVVTATRRSETVQSIPSSVTALPQSFLQDSAASNLSDVVHAIPGLAFDANSAGTAVLSIRGVNTSSSTSNVQSPVALYLDEVPVLDPIIPHAVPSFHLFDVDRVEVLSGPQGTLFGAGALGGAIRVITNKPDATRYEAATEDTVETPSHGGMSYATNLMVNLPLIRDTLALRVVGFYDHDGGWIDNPTRGDKDVNRDESRGGRVALRWTPTDDLTLTGTFTDESDSPHDSPLSVYGDKAFDYNAAVTQFAQDDTQTFNILGEYRMAWATLTSSTSFIRRTTIEQTDATPLVSTITGLAAPSPVTDAGDPSGNFIQEVRLASTGEHPYKWLVGAYFQNYHHDLTETISQAGAGAVFAGLGFPSDTIENDRYSFKITEEALFGELSYDITRQLTVTAGARAFHESVGSTSFGDALLDGGPNSTQNTAAYNRVTPKLVLSYTPRPDVLFYAQATEGYRAGQGNLSALKDPISGAAIPGAYGPDQLWNYELGAKTTLLDHRLVVDADVYYIDWSQIQLQQRSIPSGDVYTANAGSAFIRGVELQVVAKPIAPLELGTSLSYHDARLRTVNPGVDALAGDQLPGSAPFTAYVYGQYNFRVSDAVGGFVRADYSYVGREYSDLNNPTSLTYGDYSTVGAQIGLHYRAMDLLLFANNLGDGRDMVNARFVLQAPVAIRQTPRTIGLTFRAHY
jgi:iron complex outermembrane receptor protein